MIIKSFKIFEMTVAELSNEIDEFLLYFQDEGYKVSNRYRYGGGISIWVDHHPFDKFYDEKYSFNNIKDDFLRIISYLLTIVSKVSINIDGPMAVKNPICLGLVISNKEKDWEERVLKEIGLNTKIQAISIEI